MLNELIDSRKDPTEKFAHCPFCFIKMGTPDNHHHLSINIKTKVYHCYRCQTNGHFTNLKDVLGFSSEYDFNYSDLELLKKKLLREKSVRKPININDFSISPSMEKTPFLISYLEERGYNFNEFIQKYDIKAGKVFKENGVTIKKWKGRIIFPIKDNGNIYLAVGRSYLNFKPKYLNTEGTKSGLLFNIDNVNNTDKVILCEGIFSAIAAEKFTKVPAVASLGKGVLDSQLIKLRKKNVKKVILCLDSDVQFIEITDCLEKILDIGLQAEVILLPRKTSVDADDLKEKFIHFLNKSTPIKDKTSFYLLREKFDFYKNIEFKC